MDDKNVYSYITSEETSFKTTRIPLTNSKDWNMADHIERCFNVSNGWFHSGKNDGTRPKDDIVTPIIDVAFRSEGFDVKDIIPYVENIQQSYKSFIVKKYQPQWAQKHKLDTFIDEVVETSIIYDLVLIKDVYKVRPEVVKLQDIAFCDQTDVLSGPICLRLNLSTAELMGFKGKWQDDKIDQVVVMGMSQKKVKNANDTPAKTPGKYIEVYELHGSFPESWLYENGDPNKYVDQMHIVNFYRTENGDKNGITLYKGLSDPLRAKFKALKIDLVRSAGRACGRSVVERLFEPQVWRDYSGIKLKRMVDAMVNLLQTESTEYGGKKLSQLPENTILKHEAGKPITRVDMGLQNTAVLDKMSDNAGQSAQRLGSASDPALGKNPSSGTPFSTTDLVVEQGEGIHEYRQGKIATFFADTLYPELILPYFVRDINKGIEFFEELSLEELNEISDIVSISESNKKIIEKMKTKNVSRAEQDLMIKTIKDGYKKGGNRKPFEAIKDDIKDIPIRVKVNIKGKQKYMAQNADKLSKLISQILANPQSFQQIPGIGKTYNELLENSGLSPIDFSYITAPQKPEPEKVIPTKSPLTVALPEGQTV